MNLDDLDIDDRIEIYTPTTGTYWGYVTEVNIQAGTVTVDDLGPDNGQPTTVPADAVVGRRFRGRRPEGHVGVWKGSR